MAIKQIKHKGLKELFETGRSGKVGASLTDRAIIILDHLDAAVSLQDCHGVREFHPLTGDRKHEYAMSVTGNWRIILEFDYEVDEFVILDLEDYH